MYRFKNNSNRSLNIKAACKHKVTLLSFPSLEPRKAIMFPRYVVVSMDETKPQPLHVTKASLSYFIVPIICSFFEFFEHGSIGFS